MNKSLKVLIVYEWKSKVLSAEQWSISNLFLMEAYNNKNIKNVLLQNLKKENKHEAMKEGVIISQLYLWISCNLFS